jgi:hypothetical protein
MNEHNLPAQETFSFPVGYHILAGTEDHMVPFKEYEKNRQGLTYARSVAGERSLGLTHLIVRCLNTLSIRIPKNKKE